VKREGEQTLLRVFLRSTDKYSWWSSADDTLLGRAIKRGLVGATKLEGFLGLDVLGQVVEPGRWSIVQHRPVVMEFFDSPAVIGAFLADVVEVVHEGLLTLERAHVLVYRKRADEVGRVAAHLVVPGRPDPAAYLPSPEEFPLMRQTTDGQLLRIFVDDADQYEGRALYRAVVEMAQELGLANAIVLRAPMGFGTHRQVRSDRFPDYITELPVLIEIVDTPENVGRLLPFLDRAVPEGLITVEGVKILRWTRDAPPATSPGVA
jgi:PII-like signaling protein